MTSASDRNVEKKVHLPGVVTQISKGGIVALDKGTCTRQWMIYIADEALMAEHLVAEAMQLLVRGDLKVAEQVCAGALRMSQRLAAVEQAIFHQARRSPQDRQGRGYETPIALLRMTFDLKQIAAHIRAVVVARSEGAHPSTSLYKQLALVRALAHAQLSIAHEALMERNEADAEHALAERDGLKTWHDSSLKLILEEVAKTDDAPERTGELLLIVRHIEQIGVHAIMLASNAACLSNSCR